MITKERLIERLSDLEREIKRLKGEVQSSKGVIESKLKLEERRAAINGVLGIESDFGSWVEEKERIIEKRVEDIETSRH